MDSLYIFLSAWDHFTILEIFITWKNLSESKKPFFYPDESFGMEFYPSDSKKIGIIRKQISELLEMALIRSDWISYF